MTLCPGNNLKKTFSFELSSEQEFLRAVKQDYTREFLLLHFEKVERETKPFRFPEEER